MSPNTGNIYDAEQVAELKTEAPGFAGNLIELTGEEASKLNRHDRRKRLSALRLMRRQERKS